MIKLIKRFLGWNLPTKIATIGSILAILSIILFTPFFSGISILNLIDGAHIKIEILYPPIDNLIKINYKNTGGIPLNGIEIRYTLGLDKDIYPSAKYYPILSARLSTHYLGKEESGSFYINLTQTNPLKSLNCILIKETPKVELFKNICDEGCSFKLVQDINISICIPIQLNITFFSKEIPKGINKIDYYPISDSYFDLGISSNNRHCEPYKNIENKSCLIGLGIGELVDWNKTIGNISKLSKKYCNDNLMPINWCIDNLLK